MPPLVDDVGRPIDRVSALDLRRKAGAPGYPSRDSADRIQWAVESIRRSSSTFTLPGLVVAGGCLTWFIGSSFIGLAIALFPGQLAGNLSVQGLTRIGWLVLVIVTTTSITRRVIRRRIAPHIAATLVAESFCGGCAYGLGTLAADPQGIVTCPECGAGWRKSRMIASAGTAADTTPSMPIHRRWIGRRRPVVGPDDRGRLVPILDTRLRTLTRPRRDVLGPTRVASLVRATRRTARWQRLVGLLALLVVASPFAAVAIMSMTDGTPRSRLTSELFVPLTIAGFIVFLGILVWRSELGTSPRNLTSAFRARAACPSCAEDLTPVAPGPDGLTQCPVCSAAWRIGPPGPRSTSSGIVGATPSPATEIRPQSEA